MALPAICQDDLRLLKNAPRVLDIRLAKALGFAQSRNIRQVIERYLRELEGYAEICTTAVQNDDPLGRGRPGKEYWLTEEQALLICMRSDAPRAKEVRAEIITVFQAWRSGILVPKTSVPITLNAMRALFDEKLTPVHQEIAEIKGNVTFLARRVDDIVPRRDFPKDVVRQWMHVVHKYYHADCPCCRECKIIDGHSNDHFRGRELNGREDGWPVCQRCNLKLRDAEFKHTSRKHFEVFQDYLRKLWAGHALKNNSDGRQGRLF